VLSEELAKQLFTGCDVLTGALGLMITLGGSCPWRLGVPGPPALGDPPPTLNRSGATILAPGFNEFIEPDCGCRAGLAALFTAPSFGGRGLFRGSVRVVVEEEGVATGD
jgi:hypothetical protein